MSTILGNPITLGGGDIKISRVLDENSWYVIKLVSLLGTGANYWAVGDCKEVTMNGKVSDGLTLTNYSAWVFIIGFNHNAEREGNGITFQGFKATDKGADVCLADSGYSNERTSGMWFTMNNSNTNVGGWQGSLMRKNIMPMIKAALPAELQEVIKSSTIFAAPNSGDIELTSTQDEVFLLAEYEVFGTRKYASSQEPNYLKQYAYYSAGNSTQKYKHNSVGTAASWLERSPYHYANYFCLATSGGGKADYGNSSYSWGVSPCFKV